MSDRDASGWGYAPLNDADEVSNLHTGRRGGSCGSIPSCRERRDSLTSARFSSRLSCRSSVRDETQTIDEFLRKQRVVRCMQEERERAARSKLERDEHEGWVNFRALEREDRVKHLTEEELLELLQREAKEVERERVAAEEAARRVAEKTQERRRSAAAAAARTKAPSPTPIPEAVLPQPQEEIESLTRITHNFRRREEDLRAALRRAQDDAAVARHERDDAVRAREKAERRAEALDARMEELRRKTATLEDMLQRTMSEQEKNSAALDGKETILKSLQEKLKALQQENKDLEMMCKELQLENSTLTKKNEDRSKSTVLAKRQAANLAALESERQLRTQAEKDVSELRQQLQRAEAERERLTGAVEEHRSIRNRMEQQGKELQQVRVETERLREQLRNETSSRMRFEELAAQSIQGKNNGATKEQLERAEKEVKRYKEELEATRREFNTMREISDREIASIKAWCERLNAECERQKIELRERILVEGEYTPRMESKEEKRDGKAHSRVLGVKSKSKEGKEKEQQAVALVESLEKQNGGTFGGETNKDSVPQGKVADLSKNNKEVEVAAAAKTSQQQMKGGKESLRVQQETERNRITSLEREKDTVERLRLNSAERSSQERVTEVKDGTVEQSTSTYRVSGNAQGVHEQDVALQEEREKEAAARKKPESTLSAKSNPKAKSGCC